jgi:hypothetical protein
MVMLLRDCGPYVYYFRFSLLLVGKFTGHKLYCWRGNIKLDMTKKSIRWAEHAVRVGHIRNMHKVLVCKPEVMSPLGRYRHTRKDNVKINLNPLKPSSKYMYHPSTVTGVKPVFAFKVFV